MFFFTDILLLLTTLPVVSGQGRDDTREINTSGQDVVEASVSQIIVSEIFENDSGLLRRIACVESTYGTDPDTYNDGSYHGGIWKVSYIQ